ncbi:MAG: DMT family transporter [Acidobacteriota bacterium]
MNTPFLGEAAALAAAACWAIAVMLFKGPIDTWGAWTVNLAKNGITSIMLLATLWVIGDLGALFGAPGGALALVAVSGVLGMSLGDTALFAAVPRLGVHRTLLIQTLAPVFTALLAVALTDERIGWLQVGGALLVLGGVAIVITGTAGSTRADADESRSSSGAALRLGLLLAVLAAAAQGSGVVFAKMGMEGMPILAATTVRLVAATVALLVILALRGQLVSAGRVLGQPVALGRLAMPTFIGTYMALILMMTGIALAPASIAAVLLSTSPIFGLFLDARFAGVPITARALAGTLLATVGVAVLASA